MLFQIFLHESNGNGKEREIYVQKEREREKHKVADMFVVDVNRALSLGECRARRSR